MPSDILTIAVDFNDVDRDRRLVASQRFARGNRKPSIGERVWVYDDEGNECAGDVVELDDLIIYIDLDRSTWRRYSGQPGQGVAAAPRHEVDNETSGVEATPELA